MGLTIADLKVGAKLVFGSYGVGECLHPITWLKASREGEFLSEFVLDVLKFDEEERRNPSADYRCCGNGNYDESNIVQFMNSYEEDWYEPMHPYDAPPGDYNRPVDRNGDYLHHAGFLHGFEDYEIDSLLGRVALPTVANIFGFNGIPKFALFSRKGYRGRPTSDLVWSRNGAGLAESSYCDYWVVGGAQRPYMQSCVGRAGDRRDCYADSRKGFRPTCLIKPGTEVEALPDGSFKIVPFAVDNAKRRGPEVATDDEILNLMGLL